MYAQLRNFAVLVVFLLVSMVCSDELNKHHKDRYLLHKDCEKAIHRQIDEEMNASLVYTAMAAHFDNNRVARPGLSKFFAENAKEEREHAQKFIDYLNRRGGTFSIFNVNMPTKYSWDGGLDAIGDAINLEKHVNNRLYHLHEKAATNCNDPHLMDFLEGEFLNEQVESIDKLQRYFTVLGGMNTQMGEYLFDRQLSGEKSEL